VRENRPVDGGAGFTDSPDSLVLHGLSTALAPGPVTVGLRPEFIGLDPASALRGRIVSDEYLGATRCLHVETAAGRLVARVAPDEPAERGAEVGLRLAREGLRFFRGETGARLA
jgi:multiple sugar transport system ATP-binding protein